MSSVESPTVTPDCRTDIKKPGEAAKSSYKKLFLVAACFFAFATVMALLVAYMDNTMAQQYQFRKNMSQDYEFLKVAQDDPSLVLFIRQLQLTPAIEPHHVPLESTGPYPPEDTAYILKLLNNKKEGIFVEAGAYADGKSSKTEYLEKQLSWRGLLLQPDPPHFFKLKRHNRSKSQAIHACLSTSPYPKEVTYHQEVHANKIEEVDAFNTRVKCYPLYTLLLAINSTRVDLFVLESSGTELQVLQTIPFKRVSIEVISVRLLTSDVEKETIKKFMATKNYTFLQNINGSYIFRLSHIKI